MAYSTQTQLEQKFGQKAVAEWSDHDNSGAADTTVISAAIALADHDINEGLYTVHNIPFSADPNTPRSIQNISTLLAGVHLYVMRGMRDNQTDERMQEIHKFAMDWLEQIKVGRVLLDNSSAEVKRKGVNAPIGFRFGQAG